MPDDTLINPCFLLSSQHLRFGRYTVSYINMLKQGKKKLKCVLHLNVNLDTVYS